MHELANAKHFSIPETSLRVYVIGDLFTLTPVNQLSEESDVPRLLRKQLPQHVIEEWMDRWDVRADNSDESEGERDGGEES